MKVDKNIPIPKTNSEFALELEVGDSIFFSDRTRARSFQALINKTTDRRATVREVEGGWRLWRTA